MAHYYVIPDTHGCKALLDALLVKIYEQNPHGGKIIFLGDYIDRGPDSVGVINTVRNPPEGWEFIALKGNHEDMFLSTYYKTSPYAYYDPIAAKDIVDDNRNGSGIIKWMLRLPMYHVEGKNIFAHAYVDPDVPLEYQSTEELLWTRMADNFGWGKGEDEDRYLTHGHTPKREGPVFANRRMNLDTGAVFYGRLVAAKFEEDKLGPTAFLEVTE